AVSFDEGIDRANQSPVASTIFSPDMRIPIIIAAIVSLVLATPRAQAPAAVPTPDSVFGFAPGADYKLATYEQSVAYFKSLAAASPYIKLFEAGKTSQGRTMIFALISTPDNLSKIDRYREIWQRL